ncbi:hypothetical protein BDD12DRAFT_843674, partial [Trichophaea hybrida]
ASSSSSDQRPKTPEPRPTTPKPTIPKLNASAGPTEPPPPIEAMKEFMKGVLDTIFATMKEQGGRLDLFETQTNKSFLKVEECINGYINDDQENDTKLRKELQENDTNLPEEIGNLKKQVEELKTTVGILLEEQKTMWEESERLCSSAVAPTPPERKKTIRPTPTPVVPLVTQVLKRNLAKRKEESRSEAATTNEQERVEGRPSKAPRIVSPPKSLMHSEHAVGAKKKSETGPSTKATKVEDRRGYTLVWDTPTGRYESWRPHKRGSRQKGGDGERR